ncbi:MAG: DUF3501 family protein [Vulcanimicrobiaceae bacterium]
MKPITLDQLVPFAQWERLRPVLRALFIQEKELRRLRVGEHITLLFENARSVWYQVEEMLRVERIGAEDAIAHELETYNELIPREDEVSATMLVEYEDASERDAALKKLVGIERHVKLVVGDRTIAATFSESQISTEAISAVQFVRFSLPRGLGERLVELATSGKLAIEVDHPAMSAKANISLDLAKSLLEDLR